MNILHLKYVVEVEKTKSISKAAKNLYMNQPNLSRAIKELEDSLGIIIFKRTSKGIQVTPHGEEFLIQAKKILAQIEDVESFYSTEPKNLLKLSISVPRASYISCAFTEFIQNSNLKKEINISYKETNSMRAISNILQADYQLAIVRYQVAFENYFKQLFKDKNFVSQILTEFHYVALMEKNHPLASREDFALEELKDYIEIAHADPYIPSLPFLDAKKAELSEFVDKRIFVFERATQMDLLSTVKGTYMWVSPIPERLLTQYQLVEKQCSANMKKYRDVLIYRNGYKLSDIDLSFLEVVKKYAKEIQDTDYVRFKNVQSINSIKKKKDSSKTTIETKK